METQTRPTETLSSSAIKKMEGRIDKEVKAKKVQAQAAVGTAAATRSTNGQDKNTPPPQSINMGERQSSGSGSSTGTAAPSMDESDTMSSYSMKHGSGGSSTGSSGSSPTGNKESSKEPEDDTNSNSGSSSGGSTEGSTGTSSGGGAKNAKTKGGKGSSKSPGSWSSGSGGGQTPKERSCNSSNNGDTTSCSHESNSSGSTCSSQSKMEKRREQNREAQRRFRQRARSGHARLLQTQAGGYSLVGHPGALAHVPAHLGTLAHYDLGALVGAGQKARGELGPYEPSHQALAAIAQAQLKHDAAHSLLAKELFQQAAGPRKAPGEEDLTAGVRQALEAEIARQRQLLQAHYLQQLSAGQYPSSQAPPQAMGGMQGYHPKYPPKQPGGGPSSLQEAAQEYARILGLGGQSAEGLSPFRPPSMGAPHGSGPFWDPALALQAAAQLQAASGPLFPSSGVGGNPLALPGGGNFMGAHGLSGQQGPASQSPVYNQMAGPPPRGGGGGGFSPFTMPSLPGAQGPFQSLDPAMLREWRAPPTPEGAAQGQLGGKMARGEAEGVLGKHALHSGDDGDREAGQEAKRIKRREQNREAQRKHRMRTRQERPEGEIAYQGASKAKASQ